MFTVLTFCWIFVAQLCSSITWLANTTEQYNGVTLNCIPGEECKLYCLQYHACQYSTLNCEGSTSCYVRCDNHDQYGEIGPEHWYDGRACYQMTINGGSESILTIHAYEGIDQLTYSRIYAANNGPYGAYTTYLYCGIGNYYPDTNYVGVCRHNKIYAVEGFNDVRITNAYEYSTEIHDGGGMWCGANYTIYCSAFSFTVNVYCTQTNSCSDYWLPSESPTNAPSFSPTIPTAIPSNNPSLFPTRIPSSSPTFPTLQPTFNPSDPTSNPTKIPSLSPSRNPTNMPTIISPTGEPSGSQTDTPTQLAIQPSKNPTIEDIAGKSTHYKLIQNISIVAIITMFLLFQ